jgi:quercetin dioxygenase-like cupin family protein
MEPFEPTAVDLRDYVVFDPAATTGRRVLVTDMVAVDLVCLEPQQVVRARRFAEADVVYTVLGGLAWVVTDDREVTLEPLQAVLVPAGVVHGLRNDSPDPLILQVVVSPPDESAVPPGPPRPGSRAAGAAPAAGLAERLRRALGG